MATDTDPIIQDWRDRVIHGDNLTLLDALEDDCLDCVYIDPPFNTGLTQRSSPDGGALNRSTNEYEDRWPSMKDYLAFMRPRLVAIHRCLKPTGSLLLHCDWRTSHRLRCLLDDIFSSDRFVNHLIWTYGLGGSSPRRFARKHDDILFYAKSADYFFAAPKVPATSQRLKGLSKKATDVLDIPALNNMARERTGYPTQKPLALLDVLINACSPPGGVVADFFCGSGTTLVAALRSGRHYLGCDESADAVAVTNARLAEVTAPHAVQST